MIMKKYIYQEVNNDEIVLKQERFCILRINISFPLKTLYRK
jgi:hypothetical protein